MSAACPYLIVLRCTAQEHEDIMRAKRDGELPGDVIRRRLGLAPERALAKGADSLPVLAGTRR
jgi:hypothetical protein